METQLPSPKRGTDPQFSAHFYCGRTAGRIRMPLGMEVGLGPDDVLLDGDPAPPTKKGRAPNFRPCLLWQNGWMDQDATWYESRPRLRRHCVRWGPSSSSKRAHRELSAHVYCGQTAGCIRIPLGTDVGLSPGDIVLDEDPDPPLLRGHSPQFWAHVRCGKTAG